jgi:hypothetical protein
MQEQRHLLTIAWNVLIIVRRKAYKEAPPSPERLSLNIN